MIHCWISYPRAMYLHHLLLFLAGILIIHGGPPHSPQYLANHEEHARKIILSSHTIDTLTAPTLISALSHLLHNNNNHKRNANINDSIYEQNDQFLIQYEPKSLSLHSLREKLITLDTGDVHIERYIPHHSFLVTCSYQSALKLHDIPEVHF